VYYARRTVKCFWDLAHRDIEVYEAFMAGVGKAWHSAVGRVWCPALGRAWCSAFSVCKSRYARIAPKSLSS
jgi:hypothetical protein